MAEYQIKQINVDGPPNEWKGPKGTVYYISVMLEGHDKIVSIGKKTPDALKVGDTVYGEIEPSDYITDKWKHGEAPQQSSSASRSSSGSDNQYLKDTSDLPRSLIIELLKYYDVQSLYNSPQYTKMIALAQSLNDDITLMIKGNRDNSAGIVTPATRTSLGDEYRARSPEDGSTAGEPDISDEDMR